MNIKHKKSLSTKDKIVIIPVFPDILPKSLPKPIKESLEILMKQEDFKSNAGSIYIHLQPHKNWANKTVFLGLGKSKKVSSADIRNSFATAIKSIKKHKPSQVCIQIDSSLTKFAQEIGEGCQLGNYNLGHYQTGEKAKKRADKNIAAINYIVSKRNKDFEKDFSKGVTIASSVNMVRDLVNGPTNIVDEDAFAKKAREVAKNSGSKIKILDRKALQKMGMGALLGVNAGSAAGAQLITLEYKPRGVKDAPIILVGKGVLFDTGGYNLKPSSGIDTMHMDMAGAALVLGVMNLLKDLNIKKHVIGVTPVTQNLIDAHAQRPNDVVTSYSGKTIQILNTDAEGRLILADALSYAQEKWKKPQAIIDFATLTGACMVALGHEYAGLFGNHQELMDSLKNSAEKTDEGLWQLPLDKTHSKAMEDDIADLRNIDRGPSRLAGASKAAAFLQHFIEEGNNWAHIDIAGPAFVQKPKSYDYKYGTGYGVRLIADFLESL